MRRYYLPGAQIRVRGKNSPSDKSDTGSFRIRRQRDAGSMSKNIVFKAICMCPLRMILK